MKKLAKEYQAIVDDAVANGADPKAAEAYVRAGYKIGESEESGRKPKAKKPPVKKR